MEKGTDEEEVASGEEIEKNSEDIAGAQTTIGNSNMSNEKEDESLQEHMIVDSTSVELAADEPLFSAIVKVFSTNITNKLFKMFLNNNGLRNIKFVDFNETSEDLTISYGRVVFKTKSGLEKFLDPDRSLIYEGCEIERLLDPIQLTIDDFPDERDTPKCKKEKLRDPLPDTINDSPNQAETLKCKNDNLKQSKNKLLVKTVDLPKAYIAPLPVHVERSQIKKELKACLKQNGITNIHKIRLKKTSGSITFTDDVNFKKFLDPSLVIPVGDSYITERMCSKSKKLLGVKSSREEDTKDQHPSIRFDLLPSLTKLAEMKEKYKDAKNNFEVIQKKFDEMKAVYNESKMVLDKCEAEVKNLLSEISTDVLTPNATSSENEILSAECERGITYSFRSRGSFINGGRGSNVPLHKIQRGWQDGKMSGRRSFVHRERGFNSSFHGSGFQDCRMARGGSFVGRQRGFSNSLHGIGRDLHDSRMLRGGSFVASGRGRGQQGATVRKVRGKGEPKLPVLKNLNASIVEGYMYYSGKMQ